MYLTGNRTLTIGPRAALMMYEPFFIVAKASASKRRNVEASSWDDTHRAIRHSHAPVRYVLRRCTAVLYRAMHIVQQHRHVQHDDAVHTASLYRHDDACVQHVHYMTVYITESVQGVE